MTLRPMPDQHTIRPNRAHHLTLLLCPDGHYETPEGAHVITEDPNGEGWAVDNGTTLYRTPHLAAEALHHRLTRYTWHVTPGEQCAICGDPRPLPGTLDLGWWWHTACRATTDPDGRDQP